MELRASGSSIWAECRFRESGAHLSISRDVYCVEIVQGGLRYCMDGLALSVDDE